MIGELLRCLLVALCLIVAEIVYFVQFLEKIKRRFAVVNVYGILHLIVL